MSNKNILIATSSFNSKHSIQKLKKLNFNINKNPFGRKLKEQELIQLLKKNKIETVVAGLETYNKRVFDKSNIQIISRVGSGIDSIDQKLAKKNKVKIFSTPTAPADAVAELTVGMMISLSRNLYKMSNNMKNKIWKRENGLLLKKKNICIVGYGRIGKKVAQLLKPFKANIIIVDPKVDKRKKNVFTFNQSLKQADIITFHINTNNPQITMKNINKLKKNTILLNASRGNIIDEKALIFGLRNNIIKSAWLDVFSEEPYFGKLHNEEQLLLTPHCGSFTTETRIAMEDEAVNNILNNYL